MLKRVVFLTIQFVCDDWLRFLCVVFCLLVVPFSLANAVLYSRNVESINGTIGQLSSSKMGISTKINNLEKNINTDPVVMVLQYQLKRKNIYKGPLDGVYNLELAKAVRDYETEVLPRGERFEVADAYNSVASSSSKSNRIDYNKKSSASADYRSKENNDQNFSVRVLESINEVENTQKSNSLNSVNDKIVLLNSDRDLIFKVQMCLKKFGFLEGELDGIAGPVTQEAIKSFQFSQNLPMTGRIDLELLRLLGLSS